MFDKHIAQFIQKVVNIGLYAMAFYAIKPDDMYAYVCNTLRVLVCVLISFLAIKVVRY